MRKKRMLGLSKNLAIKHINSFIELTNRKTSYPHAHTKSFLIARQLIYWAHIHSEYLVKEEVDFHRFIIISPITMEALRQKVLLPYQKHLRQNYWIIKLVCLHKHERFDWTTTKTMRWKWRKEEEILWWLKWSDKNAG